MPPLLLTATILITCALLFYSLGVWLVWLVPYFGGMTLAMHRSDHGEVRILKRVMTACSSIQCYPVGLNCVLAGDKREFSAA